MLPTASKRFKLLSKKIKSEEGGITVANRKINQANLSNLALKVYTENGGALPLPKAISAPLLTHVDLERLSETSTPGPEPYIGLYLHGDETQRIEAYVCWREDIDEEDLRDPVFINSKVMQNYITYMQPMQYEMLPIPPYAIQNWLARKWTDIEDTEGGVEERTVRVLKPAYIYRPSDDSQEIILINTEDDNTNMIRPGDRVIVPETYGGIDAFGWNIDETDKITSSNADVYVRGILNGLESFPRTIYLPLLTKRLDKYPNLVKSLHTIGNLLKGQPAQIVSMKEDLKDPIQEEIKKQVIDLLENITQLQDENEEANILVSLAQFILEYASFVTPHPLYERLQVNEIQSFDDLPPRGLLFAIKSVDYKRYLNKDSDLFISEMDVIDEETSSPKEITLETHLNDVFSRVMHYAKSMRLDEYKNKINDVLKALAYAGRYHDIGKLEPRFQLILHGGKVINGTPLAKSNKIIFSPHVRKKLYRQVDWPFRKRHEYISYLILKDKKTQTLLKSEPEHITELTLYLIATHHGYGRPYFPVPSWQEVTRWHPVANQLFGGETFILDPSPDVPEAVSLESGWTNHFFDVRDKYGIYGTAFLESLLRYADAWASNQT
ncbi:hypothetical protein CULT_370044 [[Clostridium] ultunense Esp]|nr:hypothetical protein CULT_370044 [[Clostridium] ultunense Esp]